MQAENHCSADLLFEWFGVDQASKYVLFIQQKQSNLIQTNKTGGLPNSYTSLYEESEFSLM